MFRSTRIIVAIAAVGLVLGATPAHAEEDCVEALQFKHCLSE